MKEAFLARLDRAKQRLFLEGGTVDNYRPFTGPLDALDGRVAGDVAQREEPLAIPEPLLEIPQVSLYEDLFAILAS